MDNASAKNAERVVTLSELAPGERGVIVTVGTSALSERLCDLGFCKGVTVECALVSPLGDPCAYLIRGSLIALRRHDAATVTIAV